MFGARVSLQYVKNFERDHGISLPEEYREWMTSVGSGVGPDYGITPLSKWDIVFGQRVGKYTPDFLRTPFPYAGPWDLPCPDAGAPKSDWNEREREYFDDRHRSGTITIGSQGCYEHFLIVTGQCAGEVWVDDRSSDGGLYPEGIPGRDHREGERLSFYDWVNCWLIRAKWPLPTQIMTGWPLKQL